MHKNVSMHLCVIKHLEAAVSRSHPSDSLSFIDTGVVSPGTVQYVPAHYLIQMLEEMFVHKTGVILRVNLNRLSTNFLTGLVRVLVDLWPRHLPVLVPQLYVFYYSHRYYYYHYYY